MFVVNIAGVLIYDGAIDSKATTEQADIPTGEELRIASFGRIDGWQASQHTHKPPYGCSVRFALTE